MADLRSIAELEYNNVFPNANSQTPITLFEFIERAKLIYAAALAIDIKEKTREDGEWNVPSELLSEATLIMKNNRASFSDLGIMRSIPNDRWLQGVGVGCDCEYTRMTYNESRLLCDSEYHGNNKPFVILGKELLFPFGVNPTHNKSIPIVYVTNGKGLDERIEVREDLGEIVAQELHRAYSQKQNVDETVNDNANV